MTNRIFTFWRALKRFRSAITGRFVSREYAEAHPAQTVSETIKEDDDV